MSCLATRALAGFCKSLHFARVKTGAHIAKILSNIIKKSVSGKFHLHTQNNLLFYNKNEPNSCPVIFLDL